MDIRINICLHVYISIYIYEDQKVNWYKSDVVEKATMIKS
jgi:hypothetical protein